MVQTYCIQDFTHAKSVLLLETYTVNFIFIFLSKCIPETALFITKDVSFVGLQR